jgi:putative membrane protein
MFFWTKPLGLKTFRLTPEFAEASKALAANQGLYNGFLSAGLLWGLSLGAAGQQVQLFFLGCVVVAGVYGAATVGKKILFIQAMPAGVAIAALLLS